MRMLRLLPAALLGLGALAATAAEPPIIEHYLKSAPRVAPTEAVSVADRTIADFDRSLAHGEVHPAYALGQQLTGAFLSLEDAATDPAQKSKYGQWAERSATIQTLAENGSEVLALSELRDLQKDWAQNKPR
jgi:hypothetical protein